MPIPLTSEIQARVCGLLNRATAAVQVIEHLSGGYTNDNFLVEVQERCSITCTAAVARLSRPHTRA